jgi:competence protein ComK
MDARSSNSSPAPSGTTPITLRDSPDFMLQLFSIITYNNINHIFSSVTSCSIHIHSFFTHPTIKERVPVNQRILENYIVNVNTMAIIPAARIEYRSIVLEGDREIYVRKAPIQLIEDSCLAGGSTYDGRRQAVTHQLQMSRKVPIPVIPARNIYAFPTQSPKRWDCRWIFYNHVQCIIPHPADSSHSQITFNNEIRLPVDLPSWNLVKQIYKTGYLQSKFGEMVQGSELERFV